MQLGKDLIFFPDLSVQLFKDVACLLFYYISMVRSFKGYDTTLEVVFKT